jgi:hypothetical protein
LPTAVIKENERLKILLNSGIVLISAILVFWLLIIAPTIEMSYEEDFLTLVIALAYPVMDLVMLFAVVELVSRRISHFEERALILLAAFAFSLIIIDLIFLRQFLEGTYTAGGILDSLFILAYLMIGLAAISHIESVRYGPCQEENGVPMPG